MVVGSNVETGLIVEVSPERGRLAAARAALWRFVRRKPLGAVGGAIILAFIVVAVFADLIAPYPYDQIHRGDRLQGPSTEYWFGTDNLGRDLFSRIVYGARISLFVGGGATLISIGLGTMLGVMSGYLGGKLDIFLQRLVDIWISFPGLILIISFLAIVGPGLTSVIVVLGIIGASRVIRVTRGATIGIRQNTYIEGGRVVGAHDLRIMARYILPNIFAVIMVLATVELGGFILAEATISFLGYGVPPPTPTWGQMLSGSGAQYMLQQPGMAFWPGFALAIVVFGFNMLGDALRDVLDPRLRGGR
ncbi:MAG: ABC transporter permease [Dehalococcoidia bacterium]